jgi:primary-amine oxidase
MPVSRPFWIAFASGAVFAVFSLFLLISILQLPDYHQSFKIEESNRFQAPRKNVFAELTSHERTAVVDFLYAHADGLNLTRGGAEFGGQNWIDKVEVLRPNKSDVMSYHDNGSPLPERFARVSVAQTADGNAYLVQYMVGPLPPSDATQIQPLTYPHNSGRNYVQTPLPDVMYLYLWALGLGNDVVDITEDLLGAKVNALDPFGPNSLGLGARPILIEEDKIVVWLEFFRTGPGSNGVSLLPQGLYVKLNMLTQNPDNWTTGEWFYNGIMYSDIKSFREAWSSPNFTRLSTNLDGPWTDTEDFASKPYGRSQPPPLSIQPYGPRYQIDRKQQYVSWMGFSFDLATSPSTALSLFDIRFNNDRIVYHLGLQEALAHYAGSEPIQSGLEFLDTLFGMGNNMFTLVPGYDCPAYADYLDVTYHKGEHTYINRNAI